MPPDILTNGIVGTDGIAPVYDPTSRWTIWNLSELYQGQQGSKRYVPKVNDYVVDITTDEYYIVDAINPTTLIPTLRKIVRVDSGSFSMTDILLGVGPGTQSDTYRVYIDTSVMPHTLAVDARLTVSGTMCRTAKIFKGSELAGNEKVISAFYDGVGTLLGQAIPLELTVMPNAQNVSTRTVPVCYTTEELADGEVVTVVFYSDTGHVVSKRQLLVENTAFIRSTSLGTKYITSISLESPFLSNSDPKLLQYPLNVPLVGLNLFGIVQYSDGSKLRLPVDGTKFSIFGFNDFISTVIGQKFKLVLKYSLSVNEVVYGASVADGHFITETYDASTIKADGAYTVKLFGYPIWVDAITGYKMRWYLYNLDRTAVYNVTPYVHYNANSAAFDPTAYGVNQHLSVSVNLRDVNGTFSNYINVQTLSVILLGPGTDRATNWTIGFDPNQAPRFGINNAAKTTFVNQNLTRVRIDCGETTQSAWLDRIYGLSKPLTDTAKETAPPVPNFFALVIDGNNVEFPIAQWNAELTVSAALPDSGTLFIKFFKRTVDNDIQLAVAGLPIYQNA